MKTVTYDIPSWSFKTFQARKNYRCAHCDGVIPQGIKYLRHVERLGPRKMKDPLRNVHVHLDCTAPWYQPEQAPRLRHVGRLPGKIPPPEIYDGVTGFIIPAVAVHSPTVGTMQWLLPSVLAQKLAFAPNRGLSVSAIAEIEQSLLIVLTALVEVSGHQKKSMKLSHLINQMAAEINYTPKRIKPVS